jgi:hypothetical protein
MCDVNARCNLDHEICMFLCYCVICANNYVILNYVNASLVHLIVLFRI